MIQWSNFLRGQMSHSEGRSPPNPSGFAAALSATLCIVPRIPGAPQSSAWEGSIRIFQSIWESVPELLCNILVTLEEFSYELNNCNHSLEGENHDQYHNCFIFSCACCCTNLGQVKQTDVNSVLMRLLAVCYSLWTLSADTSIQVRKNLTQVRVPEEMYSLSLQVIAGWKLPTFSQWKISWWLECIFKLEYSIGLMVFTFSFIKDRACLSWKEFLQWCPHSLALFCCVLPYTISVRTRCQSLWTPSSPLLSECLYVSGRHFM